MSKRKYFIIIFLAIGLASILYYKKFGGSICLFYNFYGVPCLSCGMTRAYVQLMEFNLKGAFYFHPLFWTVPFIVIFLIFDKKKYLYLLFTVFILVWLLRMYLYFPIREPFNFNHNALIPKIYSLIF
ncbi:MAG: DUF2752 domain-containing protein [Fusobacterium sp.]|uniref:DUF2752 domain-containing protein n=1 Tax=Fusobacterium sp. TaxID=68766 RepID=UPI0026DCE7E5|nr:DUF2752 domain-containing protein [Fusobacterium sp.]MDO4689963.1 DUF2752 domain-containing protein [Fusobacterium sp.]